MGHQVARSGVSNGMKTTRISFFLLLANLLLWVFFAVDFASRLVPYEEHSPSFEETIPVFVFWGKALPVEQMHTASFRMMERVQMPAFLVVRPIVCILNQQPSVWGKTFGGLSPWSYLLVLVLLLSFLQWYLVGWTIQKLWHRWSSRPSASGAQASPTTTTH